METVVEICCDTKTRYHRPNTSIVMREAMCIFPIAKLAFSLFGLKVAHCHIETIDFM